MNIDTDTTWRVLIAAVKDADKKGVPGPEVAGYALTRYRSLTGSPVSGNLNVYWQHIQDHLKGPTMATDKTAPRIFTAYPDKGGKWRWRCQARNGRTVSASAESFHSRKNAIRAATKEAGFYGNDAVVKVD